MRLLVIFTLLIVGPAMAGSTATQEAKFAPEAIVKLAKGVEEYAAKQGARAFIIARVGRPQEELPRGIAFTHTAIAVYSEITIDNGETVNGYAIHNLYQTPGDPSKSMLVVDYPVDFFWGAKALKAGVIIPNAEVQLALATLLAGDGAKALHNPKYSAIASPYNKRYQNCTEHTLDLINAAIYNTRDIDRIKRNTNAYFDAQPVHESRLKLMLGSAFIDGVTTRDHKGKVKTATFTSIAAYLHKYGMLKEASTIDDSVLIESII